MLFSSISNLNMYTKTLEMQQKWQLKQQNLKSRNDQVNEGIISQMKALQENQSNYSVEALSYKLQAGQRLSGSELEYLRQKSPELYQKALRVAAERQAYERQLKNCKTKEDVRRLRMAKATSLVPLAKDAEARNDLEASQEVNMRANGMNNSHNKFVASKEYAKLPKDHKDLEAAKKKQKKKPENDLLEEADKLLKKQEESPEVFPGEPGPVSAQPTEESGPVEPQKEETPAQKAAAATPYFKQEPEPSPKFTVKA